MDLEKELDRRILDNISNRRKSIIKNNKRDKCIIDNCLTSKEKEVIKAITHLVELNNKKISVRLVAKQLGKAPSTTYVHLKNIRNKGYITFSNKYKSIKIVKDSTIGGF